MTGNTVNHTGQGILAIWNDCRPSDLDAYEAWYLGEHLVERVGLAGFDWGRRYRTLGSGPAYLTYYQTRSPDVLASPAYRARLDDPTPATRTIMGGSFTNMSRTVCRRVERTGGIRTAWVAVGVYATPPPPLAKLGAGVHDTLWREAWISALGPMAQTEEERLRGGDDRIGAGVLIDCPDAETAATVAERLVETGAERSGAYTLMNALDARDLTD